MGHCNALPLLGKKKKMSTAPSATRNEERSLTDA
jgi:hypothetical protein